MQGLLSKTPDGHPDDKTLHKAFANLVRTSLFLLTKLQGKSIVFINNSIKRNQTYEILQQLGIPQLASNTRSIINQSMVSVIEVTYCHSAVDTPPRVVKHNSNFQLVLFNDILAFWKTQYALPHYFADAL